MDRLWLLYFVSFPTTALLACRGLDLFSEVKRSLLARPAAAGHDKDIVAPLGRFLEVPRRILLLFVIAAVWMATS